MRRNYLATLALGLSLCPPGVQAASPADFDGGWRVTLSCPDFGDVKGFTWRFPAQVQGGQFAGRFANDVSSGNLTGPIGADGEALLTMVGSAGPSEYNFSHAPAGSKISYTITAHFNARAGSGKRNEQRPCSAHFAKG
jgi:hypothetical protein